MEKVVAFARKNGAFIPDDLQYIGEIAQSKGDITVHELLFEDRCGYIRTWSFKVDKTTGKIIPYDDGFKLRISGFDPDEMRKKLAMVDKAARERRELA